MRTPCWISGCQPEILMVKPSPSQISKTKCSWTCKFVLWGFKTHIHRCTPMMNYRTYYGYLSRLAGPDSISLMTTNLTFLMAAHPHVLKRAQMEIDEAFRNKSLTGSLPTYDECRRLPFVDACVREGLRIVASTFPRRRCSTPEVPIYLAGKYVPPGTSVSASACEIGRHKKLYGDNADEFVPDRWLQAREEQLRLWETFDVHWGFGVRKCLGKHIGSLILYKCMVLVGLPIHLLFGR
jgi:cytochrome P450